MAAIISRLRRDSEGLRIDRATRKLNSCTKLSHWIWHQAAASRKTSLGQTDALHEGSKTRVGVEIVESLIHCQK